MSGAPSPTADNGIQPTEAKLTAKSKFRPPRDEVSANQKKPRPLAEGVGEGSQRPTGEFAPKANQGRNIIKMKKSAAADFFIYLPLIVFRTRL